MKKPPTSSTFRGFRSAGRLTIAATLAIAACWPTNDASAQQTVFSRSENTSGLWWDDSPGNLPWFYATDGNSQNRPDNPVNTANFVKIGHNSNLTMTVNGTFFWLASLEIQSSASSTRTYNSSSGGGWSFRTSGEGFTNNSTGSQNVNVEVGIDAATVLFRANAASQNIFNTNFYLNGNVADFGGTSTNHRFVLNGVVGGSGGSIVKNGAGSLTLQATNTFTGGVTLNDGTIRMGANSVVSSGTVTGGSFGTGTLTINGGRIMPGGAGALYVPTMLVNSNFAINAGIYNGSDNGRASFAGIMNLAGGTRTITLGRWTNALGTLLGGQESFRFFSNNLLAATITNGTVRFARDAAGTASDFVSVNFSGGMAIGTNVGITIGSNVITTFASSDPWGTTTNPLVSVEEGGYFNLSTDVNARNARVQSLSGAGIVTSLANAAAAQSSTLTVSNTSASDSSTFSGRLVQGNLLNETLGTSATNVTLALTKAGAGTLTLAGSNNYTGTTTISGGALQIGNGGTTGSLGTSGAFVNNGTLIFNRSDNIAQGTDFTSSGISGSGNVIKNGAGTLTLTGVNSYTGGVTINAGAISIDNGAAWGALPGSATNQFTFGGNSTLSFFGAPTLGANRGIAINAGVTGTFDTAGFNPTVSGSLSNSGTLRKIGTGTLTLSAASTGFTGKTLIGGGAVAIAGDTRLGAAPGAFTSDSITLTNGGKLVTTTGFTFNANRGITLGTGGGGLEVSSGQTASVGAGQVIAGGGSLTKTGAGTLSLGSASTYSGGTLISEGFIRLQSSSILSGSNIVSGPLGVGDITISGGGILGAGQTLNATNITVNGDFAVNQGARGGLNGRLSLGANLINLSGATRTVSVGGYTNAAGSLQGGIESLRFITNATFYTPTITNGTMRFVRDAGGSSSDFASVNFGVTNIQFAGGSGFIVGTNIITTFGPGNAFVNTNGVLPHVATEDGGIFNLGTSNGVNSQTIRSLAGTAGFVTTLANAASTNTAILTISNQAGDNFNYGGRIVTGSELNATIGTTATNAAIAITKTGAGTQVLSGNNTYGGATTVAAGVLTFANTNAKSVNSQVTVQSNAVIGLGVGGSGGYDEATIDTIISNTATGYTMNVGSIVGIDTTAGNFSYGTGIANSRELWKLGANTLTLTAGSGRTGATAVTGGTLQLNATSGQAAGGTSGITVRTGATLLIAKNDQVNDTATITLSGGTIARGSGVNEVMGDLTLTEASFLDYGTGEIGTLTFGTYSPTLKLTVNNFLAGNVLKFVGSDLTSTVNNTSLFSFSSAFNSGWDSGSSTFTITAIPEPSTVLAAIGLLGLCLWPLRRHLTRWSKAAGAPFDLG